MNTTSESNSRGQGAFKYELLLLLVSLIWGSAFVAQQIGMEKGLGPMTFNGLRFALGCLSLIPFIIWRKKNLASAEGEAKLPYMGSLGAGLSACQILVIDHAVGKGDSVQIACLQFAVCAVLSALCGLLFEHCSWSQIKAASGAIAYAGLMSVGIAYTLQVVCQKHCPPAPASIIMSLEAVFAALAGYLVLHQTLTGRAIIGCFLILLGVLMVQLVPTMGKMKE